jgi:hypothetical protein
MRMLRIACEEWIRLDRLIRVCANERGTTEADVLTDIARAFKDGRFDDGGCVLIDNFGGRVLSTKDSQLWRCVNALRDRIFVSPAHAVALRSNRSSCCTDATKGGSLPSRPSQQLPPAPEAMIVGAIRSDYHRAQAAGEKPPNIKEVSKTVQLFLEQNRYRASRRQVEKLAEAEEFKLLRLPPGARWKGPRKE